MIHYWIKDQWIDFYSDPDVYDLLEEFIEEAKTEAGNTLLEKIIQTKSHQMSKLIFQLKNEDREKAQKLKPKPAAFPSDSSIFIGKPRVRNQVFYFLFFFEETRQMCASPPPFSQTSMRGWWRRS